MKLYRIYLLFILSLFLYLYPHYIDLELTSNYSENISVIADITETESKSSILEYASTLLPTIETIPNEDLNLLSNLEDLLGNEINNIGLVYYNFSTNEYVAINEDLNFIAASTYKVGLNLLYYHLSNLGNINLDTLLTYNPTHYESGTGILQNYCYDNYDLSITIQELLDLSIVYSDNIATNMLGDYIGGHQYVREELYTLLDIDYVIDENIITAEISSKILGYIFSNRDNPSFNHLIDTMTKTIFNNRLSLNIPNEIVSHKIGTYNEYYHDIGIILDSTPYILSIFTKDLEFPSETISNISDLIYLEN